MGGDKGGEVAAMHSQGSTAPGSRAKDNQMARGRGVVILKLTGIIDSASVKELRSYGSKANWRSQFLKHHEIPRDIEREV